LAWYLLTRMNEIPIVEFAVEVWPVRYNLVPPEPFAPKPFNLNVMENKYLYPSDQARPGTLSRRGFRAV
jgi:hypothetical protein